jgi:hypothetical protein
MPALTVIAACDDKQSSTDLIESVAAFGAVESIVLFGSDQELCASLSALAQSKTRVIEKDFFSGEAVSQVFKELTTEYALFCLPGESIQLGHRAIERMLSTAENAGSGLVYADFRDDANGQVTEHQLIDYQPGSVRDSFDFGSLFLVSKRAADIALSRHGGLDASLRWGGLYELRLKISIDSGVLRVPEPLYTRIPLDLRATGERQFDYVDPRRREYQLEMERVVTEHLKRIGAYLKPEFQHLSQEEIEFPVHASVIIPVRNRERTISDAVNSALTQRPPFSFNVIVVDNHSTDRTTQILSRIAAEEHRLIHLRPQRTDLGIGGCWNEAIFSQHCGTYAVQLDSDDMYSDEHTLSKIIGKLEEGPYPMVIGSYKIVDFELNELPPGLIDHREWTRENGRNNALRINGLGAPRAFYVPVLRNIGFPNVSYGEDYAVALRISRDYEIGRIFEPVYYARRWEGNSDAALPLVTANRYDAYKDHLRTVEILARQRKQSQ